MLVLVNLFDPSLDVSIMAAMENGYHETSQKHYHNESKQLRF